MRVCSGQKMVAGNQLVHLLHVFYIKKKYWTF